MLDSRLTSINRAADIKPNIKKYQPLIYGKWPDAARDSVVYEDFIDEIEHYCIHGFKPRGMSKISGKHFTFLNLCPIRLNDPNAPPELDRKILSLPFYRDMDHLYYSTMEECKKDNMGMITAKARDKGFSMLNAAAIVQEYTFFEYNEVGIAAGLESSTLGLTGKVELMLDNMWWPFKHNTLTNNSKQIESGYTDKLEKLGYRSNIYSRTVYNPNVFKGERLSLMIFEEAGEIDRLKEAYEASKPCFMDGSNMFGLPIVGGTGGNIEKSSKGFMEMWNNHDAFNLRQVFIPATLVYKGFFDFSTGKSDEKAALVDIKTKRQKILNSGDTEAYNLHVQNYPIDPSEVFLKTKGGTFDILKINRQRQNLILDTNFKGIVERGRFVWDDKENTHNIATLTHDLKTKYRVMYGSKVKFVQHSEGETYIFLHPLKKNKMPGGSLIDVMGIDSVDQEYAESSDSQMAAVMYRRFAGLEMPGQLPVAIFLGRNNNPAELYEQQMMMAMYYDTEALIEYSKIRILDFWKRWGGSKFLKKRPKAIQSARSINKNEYGVYMSSDVKNKGIELIKMDIAGDRLEDYVFMLLLDALADFGNKNSDLGMALLLAKLFDYELAIRPIDIGKEDDKKERYSFPSPTFKNKNRYKKEIEAVRNGYGFTDNIVA